MRHEHHSAIEVSDESSVHVVSDDSKAAWEALFVPSESSHTDPNRAPTVVASIPWEHYLLVGYVVSVES